MTNIEKPPPAANENRENSNNQTYYFSQEILFFALALLLYMFLAIQGINDKYVDFGDGNYLYLSWQVAQGETLYKDLPSPQPPLLLFLGAGLLKLTGGDPILIRLWQVIQHALTACCVFGIAAILFGKRTIPALAGIIYLFLPEGVWWASGYQSEPLLILLQCFNLLLLLQAVQSENRTYFLYGAGLSLVLTCYTNMTALPYALLQIFFVWWLFRHHFLPYFAAFLVPGLFIFIFLWFYSHGQYVDHVFFRQVGTYPSETFGEMFSYFLNKLHTEGWDIMYYEGGFVLASMAGILLYTGEDSSAAEKPYIVWWGIFSLGSIIFVTKGGTVEYIFTIGEPAVAVFSAFFFAALFFACDFPFRIKHLFRSVIDFGKFTLVICLVLPALLVKPISLLYYTFGNVTQPTVIETDEGPKQLNTSIVFEIPSEQMKNMKTLIEHLCPPEKTMIAPPYYAFYTKRELSEHSSSLFILYLAFFNEWKELKNERNLALDIPTLSELSKRERQFPNQIPYSSQSIQELSILFQKEPELQEKYPAIQLFLQLRKNIITNDVGLIIKNERHFFFRVPPLDQAIREYCVKSPEQPLVAPREEELTFYIPR